MKPIKPGQKYRTRGGDIVVITRIDYNIKYANSTYAAEYLITGTPYYTTQLVWGDGEYVGRKNQSYTTDHDLVELISSAEFNPIQLSLFD